MVIVRSFLLVLWACITYNYAPTSSQWCSAALQQANSSWPGPGNGWIAYSFGYKCNYGIEASIYYTENNIEIYGAYGAGKALNLNATKTSISFKGDASGIYIQEAAGNLTGNAQGTIAALGAEYLQFDTNLNCYGDMSCSYANITDTPLISGYGAFSLSHAIIYANTNNNNNVTINLYGYFAGYNSTVFCNAYGNHFCKINCFGNGCHNTKVYNCLLGINCIISCDLEQAFLYSNDIDSDYYNCPLLVNSSQNMDDSSIIENVADYTNVNGQEISFWGETICSDENSVVYDDYSVTGKLSQNLVGTSSAPALCCRAFTCFNAESIKIQSENGVIVCSAAEACYTTQSGEYRPVMEAQYNGSIICSGRKSCYAANLYASNTAYCTASHGYVCFVLMVFCTLIFFSIFFLHWI